MGHSIPPRLRLKPCAAAAAFTAGGSPNFIGIFNCSQIDAKHCCTIINQITVLLRPLKSPNTRHFEQCDVGVAALR
jgi:hypothetical protein